MIDWKPYLESVCQDAEYTQWERVFIRLDAEGGAAATELDIMVEAFREPEKPEQEGGLPPRREFEKYDALEGLRKFAGEHVLLRGGPGSGKTTILRKLLLEEAEKAKEDRRARIPVLVALRRYATSARDLVRDSLQRNGVELGMKQLGSLLSQGRLSLLCDGINELPREESRRDLESFRVKYRASTPMVFTTRDVGIGGDLGISKKLEMVPPSPKQIESFVHAYLVDRELANRMLRSLKDRMRDLARTPLLLWMICSVFMAKKKMPDGLGQVFKIFTRTYEREVKGAAPVKKESRRWWPRLLAKLAYYMIERGEQPTEMRLFIWRDEAENVLRDYLAGEGIYRPANRVHQILDDLINHHLLTEDPQGRIEFLHQLVQEYYAAEHLRTLLPGLAPAKLKRDYLNYLKWTEPVAMMLEFVEKEAEAIDYVRLALEVDPILGARLAGSVKKTFQQSAVLLVHRRHEPSELQIELLARTRSETAILFLAQFLDDEKARLRRGAVTAMGEIGGDEAVKTLIEALAGTDEEVRGSAAYALGEIGSDEAVKTLIKALGDEDGWVRRGAAWALGKIGSDEAVKPLIKALGDEQEDVPRAAARALGEIGGNEAIKHVIGALRDKNPDVRSSAARALGEIGGDEAVKPLTEALGDENESVRMSAASALGEIGSDEATNYLIAALDDKDPDVRSSAAEALAEIGGDEVVNYLIRAFEDKDPRVRGISAWALAEIGGDEATSYLIAALDDKDPDVRSSAVQALGKIGGDEVVNYVIKAFEDKDRKVRRASAWALAEIGGDEATSYLIAALDDKDPDVRSSAVQALGKIGGDEVVNYVIKAFEDKDPGVRRISAWALGKIGGDEATNYLIAALDDKDPDVRYGAARALWDVGTNLATEFLMKAVDSDLVPTLVLYAARPILSFNPRALPHLTKLAQQRDLALLYVIAATQERCGFYNPTLLPIDRRFSIVHLSDLHFGGLDKAGDLYVELLLELKKDLKLPGFEALVISGDVVNQCNAQGYTHARKFLTKIATKFSLGAEQVLIVPGNHDMSRDLSEAAYKLKRRKEVEGPLDEHLHIDRGDLVEVKDPTEYGRRFALFQTFCDKGALGEYPAEYSAQITWREYPDQKVLIVGMNSAWEIDHHYTSRSGIHPEAFNQAIEKAQHNEYDDWLKIAVWHHPIRSKDSKETKRNKSWMRDDGFMERLAVAGFSMILHGHAHESTAWPFSVDTGKKKYTLHVVAAGTLDADEEDLTPGSFWQYNIIKVTGTKVSVECRQRVNPRGISRLDKTWLKGEPHKSTYDFDLAEE
jgi:HEAT repeat protein